MDKLLTPRDTPDHGAALSVGTTGRSTQYPNVGAPARKKLRPALVATSVLQRKWRTRIPAFVVASLSTAAVAVGWAHRDDGYLTPESGLGYWLGIVGACAMLLLLLYPLRKRVLWLRAVGSVTAWFRTHMLLGVVGPVLILFHANFKLGSTNSNIALFAMLTVALSGLIGRYIYGKIHLGLYGRRATIDDLLSDVAALRQALGDELVDADRILLQLQDFSQSARRSQHKLLSAFGAFVLLGFRVARCRRDILVDVFSDIETQGRREGWSRRTRRRRR